MRVANWFIQHGIEQNKLIGQMKMHKLMYFAHAWWIGYDNDNLFDEEIQAWKYGPVVADLCDTFSHYDKNPITTTSYDLIFKKGLSFDKETEMHLEGIWEAYGDFSGIDLMKISIKKGNHVKKFLMNIRGI